MRESHGRFGLVDVLAAGTARTEHVHLDVGRIHFDVDVLVHLGRDEHGRERRVATIAGVERRLADEPVHARLGAQPTVRVLASELDGGALDARDLTAVGVDDFSSESRAQQPSAGTCA